MSLEDFDTDLYEVRVYDTSCQQSFTLEVQAHSVQDAMDKAEEKGRYLEALSAEIVDW